MEARLSAAALLIKRELDKAVVAQIQQVLHGTVVLLTEGIELEEQAASILGRTLPQNKKARKALLRPVYNRLKAMYYPHGWVHLEVHHNTVDGRIHSVWIWLYPPNSIMLHYSSFRAAQA